MPKHREIGNIKTELVRSNNSNARFQKYKL